MVKKRNRQRLSAAEMKIQIAQEKVDEALSSLDAVLIQEIQGSDELSEKELDEIYMNLISNKNKLRKLRKQ